MRFAPGPGRCQRREGPSATESCTRSRAVLGNEHVEVGFRPSGATQSPLRNKSTVHTYNTYIYGDARQRLQRRVMGVFLVISTETPVPAGMKGRICLRLWWVGRTVMCCADSNTLVLCFATVVPGTVYTQSDGELSYNGVIKRSQRGSICYGSWRGFGFVGRRCPSAATTGQGFFLGFHCKRRYRPAKQ